MKIRANIGNKLRVFYVVIGLALIAGSFAIELEGWERLIGPVLGGVSIVTGALGW